MVRGEAVSFVQGVCVVDPGPPGPHRARDHTRLVPVNRRVTVLKRRDSGSDVAAPIAFSTVPVDSTAVPARMPVPMGTGMADVKLVTVPAAGASQTAGAEAATTQVCVFVCVGR